MKKVSTIPYFSLEHPISRDSDVTRHWMTKDQALSMARLTPSGKVIPGMVSKLRQFLSTVEFE